MKLLKSKLVLSSLICASAVYCANIGEADGDEYNEEICLNNDYFEDYNVNDDEILEYVRSKIDVNILPPIKTFPILEDERYLKDGEIPQYVLENTPYVHLYTEEKYLPYDVEDYVRHFHLQHRNKTILYNESLTLKTLGEFSKNYDGPASDLFMTADDEFADDPEWLTGKYNRPNIVTGKIANASSILIVVEKGNGWVDAYWFYFYSFNLGPFVMGAGPYGNHIGDWEHSLTRFYKGVPVFVWMSAHDGGGAYHFNALEKSDMNDNRPIIFSARGTHANYPSKGRHSHDLPYGILSDFTDAGALWDPTQNYLGYTWDGVKISTVNKESKPNNQREVKLGTDWLNFRGHWGDDKLDPNDPRQKWSLWEWKYIEGPTGPLTKHLNRKNLCHRSKWWTFWRRCPPKNYVSSGKSFKKEGGIVCANLFGWIRPQFLAVLLNNITWGGGLCLFMNWVYG